VSSALWLTPLHASDHEAITFRQPPQVRSEGKHQVVAFALSRPTDVERGVQAMAEQVDLATLGGGCFWCLEAVFEQVRGVEKVVSGYAGGTLANPSYRQVCHGDTGHAEVVQVTFDPAVLSYREVLEFFFAFHDPTTLNRQGADVGTQYRSVIFYHSPEQKQIAEETIATLNQLDPWGRPLVTEVAPAPTFYPAEDYHQGYYRNNPAQGYCQAVVAPKVVKLRQHFAAKLKQA
jgi:peptide-methionine (S)-S-oxide reductase